jgi:hypothetical protein
MTVAEAIEQLKEMPPNAQLMRRDVVAYAELSHVFEVCISAQDADDHADCEGRVGENIVVIN